MTSSTPITPLRGLIPERVLLSTVLDPYMPLAALAKYAGLSVRTLQTFTTDPAHPLPYYTPTGSKKLVRRSEFDAWMARYRHVRAAAETVDRVVAEVLGAKKAPKPKRSDASQAV